MRAAGLVPDAHPRPESPQPSVLAAIAPGYGAGACARDELARPGHPAPGAAHDRARGPPRRARLVRAAGEHRARRRRERGRRGHRRHAGGRPRCGSPPRREGAHRRRRRARRPPRDDRRDRGAGAAEPLPAELRRRHHRRGQLGRRGRGRDGRRPRTSWGGRAAARPPRSGSPRPRAWTGCPARSSRRSSPCWWRAPARPASTWPRSSSSSRRPRARASGRPRRQRECVGRALAEAVPPARVARAPSELPPRPRSRRPGSA